MTDQITYRIRVSMECPKFFYEVGHYDQAGEFIQHVVSGFLFDTYGDAEREALPQMNRIYQAMRLRARRLAPKGWDSVEGGTVQDQRI